VQLSEKTNEYLKLKDENERLREQVNEMIERHDNEK
jgi:cell shape-determining protein MreC